MKDYTESDCAALKVGDPCIVLNPTKFGGEPRYQGAEVSVKAFKKGGLVQVAVKQEGRATTYRLHPQKYVVRVERDQ